MRLTITFLALAHASLRGRRHLQETGALPEQPVPTCQETCEVEFLKCVPHKIRNDDVLAEDAFKKCRSEIDTGRGPLFNNGCVPMCASTEKMLDFDGFNEGQHNSGSGREGQHNSGSGREEEHNRGEDNSVAPVGLTDLPALCTAENQGRCDCGNLRAETDKDWATTGEIRTYTWLQKDEQRCATVYQPQRSTNQAAAPVMLDMQCYANDRLVGMKPKFASADNYGMAWVWLSSPTGAWSGQKSTCGTEAAPMASCENNNDLDYVNNVLNHIIYEDSGLDKNQIYTTGFSQNGMFSGLVGVCLGSSVIAGSWIGGAGMYRPDSEAPIPPGGEGTAEDCKYWPAYPCYDGDSNVTPAKNKLKVCLQTYEDDGIVVNQDDKTVSHVSSMLDAMTAESYDATSLVFPDGRHSAPKQGVDWMVACLGIPVTATGALTLTLTELMMSEKPVVTTSVAGAFWGEKQPTAVGEGRPETSICVHTHSDGRDSVSDDREYNSGSGSGREEGRNSGGIGGEDRSGSDDKKAFNCMTKEMWSGEKKEWCCKHKQIGCHKQEEEEEEDRDEHDYDYDYDYGSDNDKKETGARCSKSCEQEFLYGCVPHHMHDQHKAVSEAFAVCRVELDNRFLPLKNNGCVPNCRFSGTVHEALKEPRVYR